MSEKAYEVAHIDDLDRFPVDDEGLLWRPVRRRLGIKAFGANAYTAETGDERVVEEHYERDGAEELYFVASGRATFTLGDEEIDAPAGTFVYAEPGTKRGARRRRAEDDGRRVWREAGRAARDLGLGGDLRRLRASARNGDEDEGRKTMAAAIAAEPDAWQGHFNAACFEALTKNRDATFEHLRRAIELDPAGRRVRAEGHGLRLAPGRPGVPGMSGTRNLATSPSPSPGGTVGDGADALRDHRLRRQRLRRATRPAATLIGEHDELGEASGRARGALLRRQRPRDVHGQRRRDRRARGHVRLRARPRRQAQGGRQGGRDDGRHRRRHARRGLHALAVGAERARARLLRDGRLRQGCRRAGAAPGGDPDDAGRALQPRLRREHERQGRPGARAPAPARSSSTASFRELAEKDSDFDAIRDDPEIRSAIAGEPDAGGSSS